MDRDEIIKLVSKARPTSFFVGYRVANLNIINYIEDNNYFDLFEFKNIEQFIGTSLKTVVGEWFENLKLGDLDYIVKERLRDSRYNWLERRHRSYPRSPKKNKDGGRCSSVPKEYPCTKECSKKCLCTENFNRSFSDCDCCEILMKQLEKRRDINELDEYQIYLGFADIYMFEDSDVREKIDVEVEKELKCLLEQYFIEKFSKKTNEDDSSSDDSSEDSSDASGRFW